MPRKSPAKRRRESVKVDEDENPKDGKQSKVQTTPVSEEASNPPPMGLQTNPKVSSSAVKGVPPPPIEESAEENGDLVPPAMNIKSASKAKKSSGSDKTSEGKKEKSSPAEEAAPEEMEAEDMAPSSGGGACFNFLLVFLLIGLGLSAGFVHQRIVQDLQTQLKGYQQDLAHSNLQVATITQERDAAGARIENVRSELIDLVHEIRYFARQQLKAKFGPGPMYQVEFELEIPGTEGGVNLQYITVDLDGENMPHAVLTFLSQVDAGLYQSRGFGFHHSGEHIVFGSPVGAVDGTESTQVWEASGFSRLLFHEHSEAVPHVPYTIGFSGRGPSLYFNMIDNSVAHREARDPCFGTISRGRNVVDYIHSMAGPLNPGDWKEMENFVTIRAAFVLRPQQD